MISSCGSFVVLLGQEGWLMRDDLTVGRAGEALREARFAACGA
jgi:hypothetical protein